MFQVLPALPRKQDNEFNQPLITGAVNSPEEMEITRFFFLSFIRGLIGTVVACWQLAFFGFYFIFFCVCVFFFVVAVWAVGAWQELESLDQARVTLGNTWL